MIVGKKTFGELMDAAVARLMEKTGITNLAPGSIARALLEVQNELLAQFYDTLDFNIAMSFLSTSEGPFLDMLGELLNCRRLENETDDNYKYRISQQVNTAAAANQTALRLEILSQPGVRDVIMRPYTLGAGSFTVYVVPESYPMPRGLIDRVQEIVNEKAAYGVNGQVLEPRQLNVDMQVRLYVSPKATNKSELAWQARAAIIGYLADLLPGEKFYASELIQRVKDVSDYILDLEVLSFSINDVPAVFANQEAYWDEVFVPRIIEVE